MANIAGSIRRSSKSIEVDRETWPSVVQVIFAFEVQGSGDLITPELTFGTVFEGPPFFSYGVELVEGEQLVSGDFPFVSAGVSSWVNGALSDPDSKLTKDQIRYLGGAAWLRVVSMRDYRLSFALSFEGLAFKNPELLQ